MGLSHDRRAPLGLTDAQQEEVRNHPHLLRLREKREWYQEKLAIHGYKPIDTAKGTKLYARYEQVDRQVKSTTTQLKRARKAQAIRDFHDTIDDLEIDKQLDGTDLPEMSTRASTVEFEFSERAKIVRLLSQKLSELDEDKALKTRINFIRYLTCYCHKQESRRLSKAAKPLELGDPSRKRSVRLDEEEPIFDLGKHDKAETPSRASAEASGNSHKRKRTMIQEASTGLAKRPKHNLVGSASARKTERHNGGHNMLQMRLPMKFNTFICIRCFDQPGRSWSSLLEPFARKCTLQQHLKIHIDGKEFKEPFRCAHPDCSEIIEGVQHYQVHALRVHGVQH